jgi:hypothetical protein
MGHPDPTSGATGLNVFGVNLDGDYDSAMGGPFFVRSSPVTLWGRHSASVRYQRWLNTEGMPHASAVVQVSTNNVDWTTIWQNSGDVMDAEWTAMSHSIAAATQSGDQIWVRWGYGVHSTEATPCSGWNLDDIEIWAVPEGTARIALEVDVDTLSWTAVQGAVAYDVVRGDLDTLVASGGDYTVATQGCEAADVAATSVTLGLDPAPGTGQWYLVRGDSTQGPMTYQALYPSQVGLRDEEIQASGVACP